MKYFTSICIFSLMITTGSFGQRPLLNYQGRLLNNEGQPVNAAVNMAINIYTNLTDGTASYSEVVGTVVVVNGIYSFAYGTNQTEVRTALQNKDAYLELVIEGTPLAPRQALQYAPYAMSIDEKSLVQDTQFLLDMVAKHEIEIQALRAIVGLADNSIGANFVTETFPVTNGYRGMVNRELTTAEYFQAIKAYGIKGGSNIATITYTIIGSNCIPIMGATTPKVISNINSIVTMTTHEVSSSGSGMNTGRLHIVYHAASGVYTETTSFVCTNSNWHTLSISNPISDALIFRMEVFVVLPTNPCYDTGYHVYERNTQLFQNFDGAASVALVLNLPANTNRLTSAAVFKISTGNPDPDLLSVSLTDGINTISNITLGAKQSLEGLSMNPTRLYVNMKPPPDGGDLIAIESVMYKWWTD